MVPCPNFLVPMVVVLPPSKLHPQISQPIWQTGRLTTMAYVNCLEDIGRYFGEEGAS